MPRQKPLRHRLKIFVSGCCSSYSLQNRLFQNTTIPRSWIADSANPKGLPKLTGQCRPQFRPQESPHFNLSAMARQLNQRTVASPWLNPYPIPIELCALKAARFFKLNHQPAFLQQDMFSVSHMPPVHNERRPDGQQFYTGEWQHQHRAVVPEVPGNHQRHQTERCEQTCQLRWRHRAIALQAPVHPLGRHRGKAKNGV